MYRELLLIAILLISCQAIKKMDWPQRNDNSIGGTEFYRQAFPMKWKERDSFVVKEILSGNLPDCLKKFQGIETEIQDSSTGKEIKAIYFVAADYLSIGSKSDRYR